MEKKSNRDYVLVVIEAMKIETPTFAESNGVVDKVIHHAGPQVDIKDVVVIMKP